MESLALSRIRTDAGCQPRAGVSSEVVDDYAALLLAGTKLPPVVVFHDGAEHYLADGYHRFEAHKRIKRKTIQAEIKQGSLRDAILHSLGANQAHGLRRTNGDKRRAVTRLLQDEEWSGWSDGRIAEHCGVSQPFVLALRKELRPQEAHNRDDLKRLGRDGKTYPAARSAPKAPGARRTSEHAQDAPDDGLPVRDDGAEFDPDAGEVFEGDEPEFEREAGGNAEVRGEQQASSLEESAPAEPVAPAVQDQAVIATPPGDDGAPHAADDRESLDSDRQVPEEPGDVFGALTPPDVETVDERAREYLVGLLKIVSPQIEPLPDLMGVCTQIDHVIADLQLKARYPEERRADGTVAFHINPDDERSRLENGLAIAMPPTRNRDPADAARAYSLPLYSDDLSRFVEWMIDFEARFRSIHGTGNEAALASEAAA